VNRLAESRNEGAGEGAEGKGESRRKCGTRYEGKTGKQGGMGDGVQRRIKRTQSVRKSQRREKRGKWAHRDRI